jgi:RimJ/RimL family protein N-acetyltransferase
MRARSHVVTAIELLTHSQPHVRLTVPIRTARLQLRPFDPSDTDSLAALFADPEATRWMDGVKTRAEMAASVLRMRDSFDSRGWGNLAVVRADTAECLGYCGVRPLLHTQDVEIAFGILRSHWGQGFGTEAGAAYLDAAFATLSLQSVVATVYPENTRSLAVIRKLRMKKEGEVFGAWPHTLAWLFRVTKDEWAEKRG